MPFELFADEPGHAALREYEDQPIQSGQVRAKSLFSAVKHGTEFRGFQANTPDASDRYDREWRLHMRGEPQTGGFPKRLGNMCLAEVIETGADVSAANIGDQIFGHFPVRETHTVDEKNVEIAPKNVSGETLVYADPAAVAVGGARDGNIRLGDRVAVFGLGAIGLMAAQVARVCGARWVVAVDLFEKRRAAALRHGADLVLDPNEADIGFEVKKRTGKLGVDVAIETSGASGALYDALRCTRFQGTVVSTAYYNRPMEGLLFAGEWHRNRIQIRSSRSNSEPSLDYGWNFKRICGEALDLLVEGKLKADGLIDPVVPFKEVANAYMEMNAHPETAIKLGVDHTKSE